MKKIFLLIALLIAGFSLHGQGQEAYIKAMQKGLTALGQAGSLEETQAVASQFERISAKIDSEWHPHYYAALSYINMSFKAEDIATKDSYTSKAQTFIDKAKAAAPNNSEVVALQGYNYMAQLAADSGNRGQMLSPKVMQHFSIALKINPENPRAQALLAQMQFGMAQFFGSPTDKPCAMVKKTLPAFDAQETGKSLDPTWGKDMAESLIAQCGK
ncbi:tetratricopeptide repeat protein [Roseivirga misakiensis]|uniref:Uncharacterized protein n=1 Tax=Roseivirga misakiensis TaxID=1563681 RepID=A0A1E5T6G0_9BACT|nr:hypothetical protein [Roseivirga misakiensis]OEK06936.1 hypothetical protein BFP71_04580 [Roseivirga misakiensis]